MHKLTSAPKLCLSPIDSEIQAKCDQLLQNEMFKGLLESKGWFFKLQKSLYSVGFGSFFSGNGNLMKGILSYYHSNLKNRPNLCNAEYLLVMPFIYVHYPPIPK
jgi:hypothetical protein